MVELVDALDSKSSSERSVGSIPTRATRNKKYPKRDIFYFCLWFSESNRFSIYTYSLEQISNRTTCDIRCIKFMIRICWENCAETCRQSYTFGQFEIHTNLEFWGKRPHSFRITTNNIHMICGCTKTRTQNQINTVCFIATDTNIVIIRYRNIEQICIGCACINIFLLNLGLCRFCST